MPTPFTPRLAATTTPVVASALALAVLLGGGPLRGEAGPAGAEATTAAAPTAAPPTTAPATAAATAAAHLRAFQAERRIPGLSVALGRSGEVVWAEAFGVADLSTKTPLTVDSVFPIGSTSKVLTSLALGRLVEDGRLDVDAPIQTYVPGFPVKEHPLTARLLAGHLSGLRNYDMAAGEYTNQRAYGSVTDALAVFHDDPLLFTPGTSYAYSVYNFVLLSAAIEAASGRDFLGYVEERVITPAAMTHTGPDRRGAPAPGRVTDYVAGWGGAPVPPTPVDVSNKWAAGGFASTPSDMVRLGNAVLAGQIVSRETFTLLTTPQRLADGSESPEGYAMGWRAGRQPLGPEKHELWVVHHGGAANGAMSFFVIVPEEELVVALQGNLLFQPFGPFAGAVWAVADAFLAGAQAARAED
jgi:serine beta-lactamase-like protein LACTB